MTDVQIFSTPICPYCTKIKKWLDQDDYEYTEHNVTDDREKAKEMVEKTGQRGVPQTFVGEQAIVGFQPDKIEQAIEQQDKN